MPRRTPEHRYEPSIGTTRPRLSRPFRQISSRPPEPARRLPQMECASKRPTPARRKTALRLRGRSSGATGARADQGRGPPPVRSARCWSAVAGSTSTSLPPLSLRRACRDMGITGATVDGHTKRRGPRDSRHAFVAMTSRYVQSRETPSAPPPVRRLCRVARSTTSRRNADLRSPSSASKALSVGP